MELIEVRQRVGKSVLIDALVSAGKKVVTVTNGDWFPGADTVIPVHDLTPMMKDLLKFVTQCSRKFSQVNVETNIDYLCFHLQRGTTQEEIDSLIKKLNSSIAEIEIDYVMVMHQ
jgi:hypothetical protein